MIVANCGGGVHLDLWNGPLDLQEISIILPRKLQRISKLLILKQVILSTMERGTTQIKDRVTSDLASAGAGVEPAAEELDDPGAAAQPVGAPGPAGSRAREFEWSLATYFGQSFVVGAYRAPGRG